MAPRSKLFANAGLLAFAAVVARVANVVVLALLARAFGASDVGAYVVACGVMAFAFLGADAGVGQWTAREVGVCRQDSAAVATVRASGGRLRVVLGAALGCVALGVTVASGGRGLTFMCGVVILAAVLQSGAYHYECLARGFGAMGVEAASGLASGVLLVAGTVVVVVLELSVEVMAWVLVISSVGRLLAARALTARSLPKPAGAMTASRTLGRARPYLATTIAAVAFVQVDVLLIALMAGQAVSGEYAQLSRPVMAAGALTAYAANALIPHLAGRSWTSAAVSAHLRRLLVLGGAAGAVAAVALLFLGPILYRILYGEAAQALLGIPLWLLAPYVLVSLCNALWAPFFTAIGRQPLRALATWVGLCASVLGVLLLVPQWGLAGATGQLAAAELVLFLALLIGHSRTSENT